MRASSPIGAKWPDRACGLFSTSLLCSRVSQGAPHRGCFHLNPKDKETYQSRTQIDSRAI